MHYAGVCDWCGEAFITLGPEDYFCSEVCSKAAADCVAEMHAQLEEFGLTPLEDFEF